MHGPYPRCFLAAGGASMVRGPSARLEP